MPKFKDTICTKTIVFDVIQGPFEEGFETHCIASIETTNCLASVLPSEIVGNTVGCDGGPVTASWRDGSLSSFDTNQREFGIGVHSLEIKMSDGMSTAFCSLQLIATVSRELQPSDINFGFRRRPRGCRRWDFTSQPSLRNRAPGIVDRVEYRSSAPHHSTTTAVALRLCICLFCYDRRWLCGTLS